MLHVISGSFPLPRPFARYARSLVCGERTERTKWQVRQKINVRGKQPKSQDKATPRRGVFSIGSAPLTSITKIDAQIRSGETRQDLKIPGVEPV
ncbi:hypothetical protein CRG94_23630 [Escherichia sp. E3356]|nr:hypothetical protein CRG94_23630 [Escherichia sp. E3356]